jgi:hypothetical protein
VLGDGVTCGLNVGLRDVAINQNFWRLTAESDEILECRSDWNDGEPNPCCGSGANCSSNGCVEEQEGPTCKVCSKKMHFIDDAGICTKCPSAVGSGLLLVGATLSVIPVLYLMYVLLERPPKSLKRASENFKMFLGAVQSLGPSKVRIACPVLACGWGHARAGTRNVHPPIWLADEISRHFLPDHRLTAC